jgi:hypothetical protein
VNLSIPPQDQAGRQPLQLSIQQPLMDAAKYETDILRSNQSSSAGEPHKVGAMLVITG